MSVDRDQAGAPVEQVVSTETQVLAAVERATDVSSPAGAPSAPDEISDIGVTPNSEDTNQPSGSDEHAERPVIAALIDPPNASKLETAEEIFAAHPSSVQPGVGAVDASTAALGAPAGVADAVAVTTVAAANVLPPVRDGEIRISSDHPMAALYMQSPLPPEIKGNRGAGVLIALLATFGFALVYAGVLALWLAPNYPPSTFINAGLLPWLLNWGFAAASIGFFAGFALLVLIVGRAGWWAYVLGGLLIAAFTWVIALFGFALDASLSGAKVSFQPFSLLVEFGLFFPVIAAALVGREISVWFGAWIGARGRKVQRLNTEAVAEYETALAEVQAKLP